MPVKDRDLRIAPKVKWPKDEIAFLELQRCSTSLCEHWTALDWERNRNGKVGSPEWNTAVRIFADRVSGRFLIPIDVLLHNERSETVGFAIMALECLLIETLMQFEKGVSETPQSKIISSAKQYFKEFLTKPTLGFTGPQAECFYETVRCGILHQAETKMGTLIKRTKEGLKVEWQGPKRERDPSQDSIVIYRDEFHQGMIAYLMDYVEKVSSGADNNLLAGFMRKMDFISQYHD